MLSFNTIFSKKFELQQKISFLLFVSFVFYRALALSLLIIHVGLYIKT